MGLEKGSNTVLGFTHVVEQLSFSFSTFWGPNGLFLGLEKGSNFILGSTHIVEQLSYFMLP